jgi:hypothetical protein
MKNKILLAAVLATLALSGCNRPADTPAAPAGAPGPAGPPGATGNTGATGDSGATQYAPPAANTEAAELPAADIGVDVASYPQMDQVPGYPVYYAPGMNSNYFFYDGMYWVYQRDNWYASTWYNGPWGYVAPEVVPLFILRVPVQYYRQPPAYFHGWQANAAPQWGVHWGNGWSEHRKGWDQWNHNSVPAAAPLPAYQREFSGNKYPARDQQLVLHNQNYHYQPKDAQVEHVFHAQAVQKAPAPSQPGRPAVGQEKQPRPGEPEHNKPEAGVPQKALTAPHPEPGQREVEKMQKPEPGHPPAESKPSPQPSHQPEKAAAPHEQPAPRPPQEKPAPAKSAPEPKPAPPVRQESRPPQKEAAPHEQPAAKPAPAPKEKEEKREEERK